MGVPGFGRFPLPISCPSNSPWPAADLVRRSAQELGSAGLAQQEGYRTPQAMVESMTGSTKAGAVSMVEVGKILADTDAAEALQREHPELPAPPTPWQAPIAHAVTAGGGAGSDGGAPPGG